LDTVTIDSSDLRQLLFSDWCKMTSHSTIFISTMFSAENLTQIRINRKEKCIIMKIIEKWLVGTKNCMINETWCKKYVLSTPILYTGL
jgi:hypothetical protein